MRVHAFYNISTYNIEISQLDDERTLLYNSLTSSFCIVDFETIDFINSIDSLGEISKENFTKTKNLKKLGVIIDSSIDELAMVNLVNKKQRFGNNVLSLTIAPTLNCNMACPYCYEKPDDLNMSRKGSPYDNAPMESFFQTLKTEHIYKQSFQTIEQATASLKYWIDVYYNCRRLHFALGYKSPLF